MWIQAKHKCLKQNEYNYISVISQYFKFLFMFLFLDFETLF